MTGHWRVRLGAEAERDFARILRYTKEAFGDQQFHAYKITLLEALAALESGVDVLGSVARDEIFPKLRTLHVARKGRRGRHFILYRVSESRTIDVIRILHDQKDMTRHIPPELT